MQTLESQYELLFSYLKESFEINTEKASVSVSHPDSNDSEGILVLSALNDSAAGRYITEDFISATFQITKYHENFGGLNRLNSEVRKAILEYL